MKMRINLGQTIALILALVMLFGLMPMTVMATDTSETPEEFALESELNLLSTTTPIGTVLGEHGGVRIIYQGFIEEGTRTNLRVQIQNDSDVVIIVQTRSEQINGNSIAGQISRTINPGNVYNTHVAYHTVALRRHGIESIDQIVQTSLNFHVILERTGSGRSFTLPATILGALPPPATPHAPPPSPTEPVTAIGNEIMNEDGVRITYQGMTQDRIGGHIQVRLRIENTNNTIRTVQPQFTAMNRMLIDSNTYTATAPANSTRDAMISFPGARLIRNGITNVDEVVRVSFDARVREGLGGAVLFTVPDVVITPDQTEIEPPLEETRRWLPAGATNRFADVPNGRWPNDPVSWAYNNKITSGVGDGTRFNPNGNLSREMFATFLHRIAGTPTAGASGFYDAYTVSNWATSAINWASDEGVILGFYGNMFAPHRDIERQQIAVMLFRYAEILGLDMSFSSDTFEEFPDTARVSDWAEEAMQWATYHGLITGQRGNMAPRSNATRAETVTMLQRFVETFEIPAPQTP